MTGRQATVVQLHKIQDKMRNVPPLSLPQRGGAVLTSHSVGM